MLGQTMRPPLPCSHHAMNILGPPLQLQCLGIELQTQQLRRAWPRLSEQGLVQSHPSLILYPQLLNMRMLQLPFFLIVLLNLAHGQS
jgi:hypothetical protein